MTKTLPSRVVGATCEAVGSSIFDAFYIVNQPPASLPQDFAPSALRRCPSTGGVGMRSLEISSPSARLAALVATHSIVLELLNTPFGAPSDYVAMEIDVAVQGILQQYQIANAHGGVGQPAAGAGGWPCHQPALQPSLPRASSNSPQRAQLAL